MIMMEVLLTKKLFFAQDVIVRLRMPMVFVVHAAIMLSIVFSAEILTMRSQIHSFVKNAVLQGMESLTSLCKSNKDLLQRISILRK